MFSRPNPETQSETALTNCNSTKIHSGRKEKVNNESLFFRNQHFILVTGLRWGQVEYDSEKEVNVHSLLNSLECFPWSCVTLDRRESLDAECCSTYIRLASSYIIWYKNLSNDKPTFTQTCSQTCPWHVAVIVPHIHTCQEEIPSWYSFFF